MTDSDRQACGPEIEGRPLPTVSVVIPTYNRLSALIRCLKGLLAQDYPRDRLEIIVVNDGGMVQADGGVLELRAEMERLDPHGQLRLLQQRNQGPAAARNHGAREGRGQFLAFTDDDCCPRSEWLTKLIERLALEPRAMVGGRVLNALATNPFSQASQDLISFLYEYFPHAQSLRPFLTTNNVAMDRERFLEIRGFDESFRLSAGEDRDLSERWVREVGPLRFVDEAVVDHYHELSFRSFVRQHRLYGRGAVNLGRCREARDEHPPRPEPASFYALMLAYPFRGRSFFHGLALSSLVVVAQASGLTGMAAETLRRRSKAQEGEFLDASVHRLER